MRTLPISYLRECFDVDFETGVLTWKVRPVSHFKGGLKHTAVHRTNNWNSKRAGKIAGSHRSDGYLEVGVNGRKYLVHRIVWALARGEWPSDQIDHANGDRTDNRLANLSVVTQAENGKNQKTRGGSSVYAGVSWHKANQKWRAQIRLNGKRRHRGYFDTEIEAAAAYRRAAEAAGFTQRHVTAADGTIPPRRVDRYVVMFPDVTAEAFAAFKAAMKGYSARAA